MSIENKKIKDEDCPVCGGQGCQKCNGTGRSVDYYSYYIDDEKGIAFGGDPGK